MENKKTFSQLVAEMGMIPALIALTFIIGGVVLVTVGAVLWQAYVMHVLWGWFAVPLFAVPAFTTLQIAGFISIFALIRFKVSTEKGDMTRSMIQMAAVPAIALVIGWIIKLCM